MNTNNFSNSKSVRFSTEIEGEGMELCLRGLLVACLLSALAICNLSIGNFSHNQPAPTSTAVVTIAKPIVADANL